MFGDAGHDHMLGGQGDDIMVGGDGNDEMIGDEGDDTIIGGAGDDFIHAGSGPVRALRAQQRVRLRTRKDSSPELKMNLRAAHAARPIIFARLRAVNDNEIFAIRRAA